MNLLQEAELNELEWEHGFGGEPQEEQEQGAVQRFEITDINSLNWVFRKLSALKAKEEEITNLAKAEIERIRFWEESEKSSIQKDVEFFEMLINEYHAKVLAENPKQKTISTPYGKSKARTTKAQPEKINDQAVLQHVVDNGMEEYIKPTLKWGDFKKNLRIVEIDGNPIVIDENGQAVDGVGIKPESISYKVEVEK